MSNNLDQTRSEFIEKIGVMAQRDNLPRIAGRLLGLLIWDGEAVAFGDLATQLQVSRASVSTATRILEERRLIKRTAKPGNRQDYLQLADNPYATMMESIVDGLHIAQHEIQNTISEIPDAEAGVKGRVKAYADFYEKLAEAAGATVKKL